MRAGPLDDRSFDLWLRRGLMAQHRATLDEPVPEEWLHLLDGPAERRKP